MQGFTEHAQRVDAVSHDTGRVRLIQATWRRKDGILVVRDTALAVGEQNFLDLVPQVKVEEVQLV